VGDAGAGDLGDYLHEALSLLRRETPLQFTALRAHLGTLSTVIRVGATSPLTLCLTDEPWVRQGQTGDVEVALSDAALDALLGGALTLEEGLETDRLRVKGELASVLRFLDGWTSAGHGALRGPSFPPLLERFFRRSASPEHRSAETEKGLRK
jgi:hypothetical protein